jgi:hypothetical protein
MKVLTKFNLTIKIQTPPLINKIFFMGNRNFFIKKICGSKKINNKHIRLNKKFSKKLKMKATNK